MTEKGIEMTMEEIRSAQKLIALEMGQANPDKSTQSALESASLHLRNLERTLTAKVQKAMISNLKQEMVSLHILTEELTKAAGKINKLNEILRKIVRLTGQVIDVLELTK